MLYSPFLVDLRQQIENASATAHLMGANKSVRLINEVPGYKVLKVPKFISEIPSEIIDDKLRSDFELFTRFRGLFRDNDAAVDFIQQHDYDNHYVFGLHVRAGNGETGHFKIVHREIYDIEEWSALFGKMMLEYVSTDEYMKLSKGKPPLIFVATDTAKTIDILRTHLSKNKTVSNDGTEMSIPVIHFPQEFVKEGAGVSYRFKYTTSEACYQSWSNQFMDMTLLSASDTVIAGMYSSFTQSMPLRMMIANPVAENNKRFCEVGKTGENMHCTTSYLEWLAFHSNEPNAKYTVIGSKLAETQVFNA